MSTDKQTIGKRLLLAGGLLNFCVALLHVGIIFAGAPAYRFFGAGEQMARMVEAGSPLPALLTFVLALIFAAFGFYGLSGAGAFRRLPLLKLAVLLIGGIYTLRGLLVVFAVFALFTGYASPEMLAAAIFSAAALLVGLLYLVGAALNWDYLRTPQDTQNE